MKGKSNTGWIVAIVAVFVLAFVLSGGKAPSSVQSIVGGDSQAGAECNLGRASTVGVSALSVLNGTSSTVNGYLLQSDGFEQVGQTSIGSGLTSLTTSGPTSFSGYLLLGNDAGTGTDLGPEVYFTKKAVTWNCEGNPVFANVPVKNEGTLTVTVYDDGTAEASPNVTVFNSAVDSTEIKIKVSALTAFGNPELSNPVAVCFNASTTGSWDAIKPLNYASAIPAPEVLSGKNVVGSCYVLPIPALEDASGKSSEYRFSVRLDPTATANVTNERVTALFLDKTYYKNDAGMWEEGYEDRSELVADADIGSGLGDKIIWIYSP